MPFILMASLAALRLALVGFGYWGPNYARVLNDLPGVELTAICDRSADRLAQFLLKPVSEVPVSPEAITRFRAGYRELFGPGDDDPLYEGVSTGLRPAGTTE